LKTKIKGVFKRARAPRAAPTTAGRDFATFFDGEGRVTRVEVVAYRERYGDGIRSQRFREQFVGKQATSGFRPGHEIDVISGATLSARAMAKAVKRATLLLHDTVLTSS
jgi:Na+-translocating ferredoxin:NAD+ oxidoreductase RnfG subunit